MDIPNELERFVRCNGCNWIGKLLHTDDYKGLWHCPDCGLTELHYSDGPLPIDYEKERLLRQAAPELYEALKELRAIYANLIDSSRSLDFWVKVDKALAKAEGKGG